MPDVGLGERGPGLATQSTASQYMAVLQRADLVTATKLGQWTHYRRNDRRLQEIGAYLVIDL